MNVSTHRIGFGLALAALAAATPLQGQTAAPIPGEEAGLVDRVVAVVGDSAIFMSQVQEEMILLNAQQPIPDDPAQLRARMEDVLEQLINMQLILLEAAKDSTLAPSEDEVETRVQETVDRVRSQFPTPQAFQQALAQDGLTPNSYRETLRRRIREQQIQQLYLQRTLNSGAAVAVTEEEMREVFDAQSDQLPQRPELLSLSQVMVRASASDEAWAEVEERADSLIDQLRNHDADFADLARRFSDDAGNAEQGGELPWFRRQDMVTAFSDAAFALPDGVISDPVRTEFGIHIIRVDRRRPGELKARHILLMPESDPGDAGRTLELAETVAERARAGDDFAMLQEEYGDPEQSIDFETSRERVNSELPPGYAQALAGVQSGDVVGPFQTQLGPATFAVVLKVNEVREAGTVEFEDVRAQIRDRLQQQKRLERLWESLRAKTYVDVRF